MRRLIVVAAVALGCAQPGTPPGGPEDDDPPMLVRVSPDTGRVGVRARSVEFVFDEVVSERPQGAASLEALVLISPRSGDPDVSWKRNRLVVRPRRGWRANTPYTVTVLRGLTDLRGNADSAGWTTFFSTGPVMPRTTVRGRVFDWAAARIAPDAIVEAMSRADTNTVYVAVADTAGRFEIARLLPGDYRLRAFIDQNRNRALDPRELFDTAAIRVDVDVEREMLAYRHDSIGPGVSTVTPRDSLTLRVTFDKALDTAQTIDAAMFSLKAADSSAVQIASAVSATIFERQEADSARRRAVRDSVARVAAADSARADSVRRAIAAPTVPTVPTRRPPGRPGPATPRAAADTARPAARPSVQIPTTDVVIRLAAPLRPGTSYRLRATSVRNLVGQPRDSERVFTTARRPAAEPPRAPRDSSARTDSVRSRPPR